MSDPVEHHLEVPKTARFWTLGPEEGSRRLWLVLHGYKQLAGRFIGRFADLDDGAIRIVAPEALSRFYIDQAPGRHGPESRVGATWMTRDDREHEIQDYVRYLEQLARLESDRAPEAHRTLLGFSQGVATAARLAVLGNERFDRLITWGDTLPPDLDMAQAAEALQGAELVLVRGTEDTAVSPRRADEERGRLEAAGIPYRVVEYEGGHRIEPNALRSLA